MNQLLQDIRGGQVAVHQVPSPTVATGQVLIANQASVVSAGTEKMTMDLAKKSLLGKARERPDHVRRVLEKIRTEGLVNTYRQVRQKLDEPMTMGYSSAGIVLACGSGVQEFKPGDRVASNGCHADVVAVPRNLCALVPENVTFEAAAFGVLGSIALQGVRLTECKLGERVLVVGLGLVGQLTVALLKSAGLRVYGVDLDERRCELALKMGATVARSNLAATDLVHLTQGLGVDAVIITASTKSNGPIELAAEAVRKKGRIVLVGVAGLQLDRRAFYFKEIEFVVSCSYGPGRYDSDYEERGHDYPAAYVRWTEQRNIQAVLDLMGSGGLDTTPLISHRYPIQDAEQAYDIIQNGSEPYLGMVLTYPALAEDKPGTSYRLNKSRLGSGKIRCGVIGVGNFARMVLLPAVHARAEFEITALCSAKGVTAAEAAKKYGAEVACTDDENIFADPSLSTIFSLTRHNLHANHVIRAIESGKNIFVEKPLCLTVDELESIETALRHCDHTPVVMVGFNRRFSPAARLVKRHFGEASAPLTISIRFNSGEIPSDHWTQHELEGGGRIIGEACHAIDLATFLCGSPVIRVFAEAVATHSPSQISDDQCFITLRHANGSVSNIAYLAGGDRAFPKERVEVFGGGRVAVIEDFHTVTTYSRGKKKVTKGTQRKGHLEEIEAFAEAITKGGDAPISWCDLRATTLGAILAVRSLREGLPFDV